MTEADPDAIGPDGTVRLRCYLPTADLVWFLAGCEDLAGCGHSVPVGIRAAIRLSPAPAWQEPGAMPRDITFPASAWWLSWQRILVAALVPLVVLLLAAWLGRAWWRGPLTFDDAYMFWRYALHLRQGLGLAWNPDGVPTYGLTSLPWVLGVLPFTWGPLPAGTALPLASWLAGLGALAMMATTVARQAGSAALREWPVAFAAVALPLGLVPVFAEHLTSGMDTTLSLLANAAVVWALLRWLVNRPGGGSAALVGLLGFTAVLVRPENGLCALGATGLAWLAFRRWHWQEFAGIALLPLALLGFFLLACQLYFGVPLPLGFYAKGLHAYAGFQNPESALRYLRMGMVAALPFLALLAAAPSRRQVVRAALLLLPVAATFLYLLTVRQVMGHDARYYMPFLPWLVVPALLGLDAAIGRGQARPVLLRAAVLLGLALAGLALGEPVLLRAEDAWLRRSLPPAVPQPELAVTAAAPLPEVPWIRAIMVLGDDVVARLPPGASIAASEVGYLGAVNPAVTLIDIAGLNDTRIARQGFSMDNLLARAPDLIWLPHHDYTGMRAEILAEARLYHDYLVLDGAFNYGLAIRRDSPHRAVIETGLWQAWAALYPGQVMADYVVRGKMAGAGPAASAVTGDGVSALP
jgi:hypothetical protein